MRFAVLALLLAAGPAPPSARAQVTSLTPNVVTCDPESDLAAIAPTFAAALGADRGVLDLACRYSLVIRLGERGNETDIDWLVATRDTLIERAAPVVEAWIFDLAREDAFANLNALFDEADSLALRVVQAEGMFTGLTYGAFAPRLTRAASPDLRLALHLRDFEGQTLGGYPYMSLCAEADLLAAAERMRRDFPASPYLVWSQDAMGRALARLASLHPTLGIADDQWSATATSNDYWLWAADRLALERFVDLATDSRYHAPLAAILADPPVSATEGDLDLLVVARVQTWEAAHARTLAWLDEGVDVVGPETLGERDLAVLYRYFPAGDARLDAAAARAETHGLTVERVRVDVANLWQS